MELTESIRKQIEEACREVAIALGTAPPTREELETFTDQWWKEEDALVFHIGCADIETRKAFIFVVEAARALCAGRMGVGIAAKLLKLSLSELQRLRK